MSTAANLQRDSLRVLKSEWNTLHIQSMSYHDKLMLSVTEQYQVARSFERRFQTIEVNTIDLFISL
jgi:hypothetical protein